MSLPLRRILATHRWPIFLGGLLLMAIVANATLVFVATRDDVPPPIANYYQRSLTWEVDAAALAASRARGWRVQLEVPQGAEFDLTALRPVDVRVADRDGQPVVGLVGRLLFVRPADSRQSGEAELVELRHEPGRYRALAGLGPGLWELGLDARLGEAQLLHRERLTVRSGALR